MGNPVNQKCNMGETPLMMILRDWGISSPLANFNFDASPERIEQVAHQAESWLESLRLLVTTGGVTIDQSKIHEHSRLSLQEAIQRKIDGLVKELEESRLTYDRR